MPMKIEIFNKSYTQSYTHMLITKQVINNKRVKQENRGKKEEMDNPYCNLTKKEYLEYKQLLEKDYT
jgi:hypothetical protein